MSIILPEELTVGYFDSNVAYSGVEITPKRNVTCFELEIPLEKGGISYNGENEIAIEPNFIVCANILKFIQLKHKPVVANKKTARR